MTSIIAIIAALCVWAANFKVEAFNTPISRLKSIRSTRLDVSMSGNSLRAGSVVALITPMKPDMSIDYAAFVDLLKWHVVEGTDGAVILGTTGESTMINAEDRTEIIKTAVKTVAGAFPIIVGAGTIETDKVIGMCQNAKECGADASLIITPYYIKPPQRALIKHFWDVADAVDLPMVLYNCPGRTGVDMLPETVAELSKHKGIVGIKEATGDLDRIPGIRKSCGDDFLIYSGEDDSGCKFVSPAVGGDGVISVTANVAPAKMHTMLTLSKAGQKEEAEKINAELELLHSRLFLESNPIPVKKAVSMMGKCGPAIRQPLTELDISMEGVVREALTKANCIE